MSQLTFRCGSCGGVNRVDPARLQDGPKCGRCQAALDTSGAVIPLGDEELEKLIQSSPVPVLVDFYANWCGPCRMVAPIVDRFARAHAGELIVVKVDTDRDQRFFATLNEGGIPAFGLWEGGTLRSKRVGALPLPQLEAWVQPALAR
ncbi:MAG: thioredoxin domain-containing protein [Planctomycetota bacterium]